MEVPNTPENSSYIRSLISRSFSSKFGDLEIEIFTDGRDKAIVLKKGDLQAADKVPCRIQSSCVDHFLTRDNCDCQDQVDSAIRIISSANKGLFIYLEQEGRGSGLLAKYALDQVDDRREYDLAIQIIRHYQIKSVDLLSLNLRKKGSLEAGSIEVDQFTLERIKFYKLGRNTRHIVESIVRGDAESPIPRSNDEHPRVLVIGDLNVDSIINVRSQVKNSVEKAELRIGGTGFNAALAFRNDNFLPVLFGKIGEDSDGSRIRSEIEHQDIHALVGMSSNLPTGRADIVYFGPPEAIPLAEESQYARGSRYRTIGYDLNDANDYDEENLSQAVKLMKMDQDDLVLVSSWLFSHKGFDLNACEEFFKVLLEKTQKVILDLVPNQIYHNISLDDLNSCSSDSGLYMLIAEYDTYMSFLDRPIQATPNMDDCKAIARNFNARYFVCRFGRENASNESLWYKKENGEIEFVYQNVETGYDKLSLQEKIGFGDRLTSKLIQKVLRREQN